MDESLFIVSGLIMVYWCKGNTFFHQNTTKNHKNVMDYTITYK